MMGRPVDVLTLQTVETLVERLESLLENAQDTMQAQSSSPTTTQSKNSQASAGFATQVNPRNETRGPSLIPAQRSVTGDQAKLAALLGQDSRISDSPVPIPATRVTQKSALRPLPERDVIVMNSKLDAQANVPRSQSMIPLNPNVSVDTAKDPKLVGSDIATQSSMAGDNEEETCQERAEHRDISISQAEAVVVDQQITPDLVDQLQRDDAFLGLKRVPRRYVRISEDQRAILERSDSWYESRAGDQSHYANIPATVMQELTEFMNRKPTEPKFPKEDLDDSSSDSEEGSEPESTAESLNDDSRNVVSRRTYGHQHKVGQGVQEERSSRHTKSSAKGHFPSSGPDIVYVVDEVDDDTDEDEAPSWEPTPEPEQEVSDLKSDDCARSQPPSRVQGSPASSSKLRRILYARPPVSIPPSSPTIEEELELAVPYAIGDIVDFEDAQVDEAVVHSQALPSTAPLTSTFIQVKRTPYVKSRSFDEASLHRSVTGSKRAPDEVSSDPVIPATCHDASSSAKQASSSIDQVSVSADFIIGTQFSHTGASMPHSQPGHAQDSIVASSLHRTEHTMDEVSTRKRSTSHGNEDNEQRVNTTQSAEASICIGEQTMAQENKDVSGYSSPPDTADLPNHVERHHQHEGKVSKSNSTYREHVVSPRTRLTEGQRKMFFFDLEAEEDLGGRSKDELLLEERRRARAAKRNFKAKEKLTRRASEIETKSPRRSPSPIFEPARLQPTQRKGTEAFPQSAIRILLSPTPDSTVEAAELEDSTESGHVQLSPVIAIDQVQGQSASNEDLPREDFEPECPSPLEPSAKGFSQQPSLEATVERQSAALATPRRKSYSQHSPRDSFGPESPSSAQPMADETNQLSPRQSLGSDTSSSAQQNADNSLGLKTFEEELEAGSQFAQSQSEKDYQPQSPQESMKDTGSPSGEYRQREDDEQLTARPAVHSPDVSALNDRAIDDEPNSSYEDILAEYLIPTNRFGSEVRPQPLQKSEAKTLIPSNTTKAEPCQRNKPDEKGRPSRDLTFEGFISTYPDYSGDKKCFTRALVCLEWLRKKQIPPWSMCDDFIRAYAEWEPYVRNLKRTDPEKVMTAWDYYDSNVKNLLFERRFVDDNEKLAAVLFSLNPLYVQTIRYAYNTPAAVPEMEARSKKGPRPAPKKAKPASIPPEAGIVADGTCISPELGSMESLPRRRARGPFFETPSQLHTMQRMKEPNGHIPTTPITEGSDKRRRTLPWQQSRAPDISASQPRGSPGRRELNIVSTEFKKRRQSNEHKRATLPPVLRASSSKSPVIVREEPIRPASRDSEVFATRTASESVLQAAKLSPELPDLTEKWVAQQRLVDDQVVEGPGIAETLSMPRKRMAKEPVAARRESGFSANTDSPKPAKKRRFRDLAEYAKDLGKRRRSGGMSSRASTPYSTPAKRFCTKPKGETPAKRVEPDTQAWQY